MLHNLHCSSIYLLKAKSVKEKLNVCEGQPGCVYPKGDKEELINLVNGVGKMRS